MKKTPEQRFAILVSKLRRHEEACVGTGKCGVDHDLSNVRLHDGVIEIDLKGGRALVVTGSDIQLDGCHIAFEEITGVEWITPGDATIEKARLKQERFDYIYLETAGERIPVEGMGQVVFPVMSFINWAIRYG